MQHPHALLAAAVAACFALPASADHIDVTGARLASPNPGPQAKVHVTADELADTVNVVNTEDALKYLPEVFVRKRHVGDTQAPMTTRTSGVNASARSLVYADGVLLSALLGNNNAIGGPRWGMVSPDEIARVDVLYGPYSAAYAGNSMGAVVEIATRMPTRFEAGAEVQATHQSFDLYGHGDNGDTLGVRSHVGSRDGAFSWWLSADETDSHSQPLSYATASQPTALSAKGTPVSGAVAEFGRTGAPVWILGAGGLEHQRQDNAKLKFGYDVADGLQARYTLGLFRNRVDSDGQSWLRDAAGNPVYAGSVNISGYNVTLAPSAFSNGIYRFDEQHLMQALSLKSMGERFDWEALASDYRYITSSKRTPTGALPAAQTGGTGTLEDMSGTGWQNVDLKARWQWGDAQKLSFGAHYDRYRLVDPKYATSAWQDGAAGDVLTDSRGTTRTLALWVQQSIELDSNLDATLGGRYERWRAFDGDNYASSPKLDVRQPALAASGFSPKATLDWRWAPHWSLSGAIGVAYRFPTVAELYQAVTTGATLTSPNPNLKPERGVTGEIALSHSDRDGSLRLALFEEDVRNALVSQSAPLLAGSATLYNYVQNVDKTRVRGIELAATENRIAGSDVTLSGSVSYVDPKIVADATAPAAVGKQLPYVPHWRATAVATWRLTDALALTLAGRYSQRVYGAADNSDVNSHTYTGFEGYFIVDARAHYQVDKQWSASLGIDNVGDRKYFLYHPFPQRTVAGELKYRF